MDAWVNTFGSYYLLQFKRFCPLYSGNVVHDLPEWDNSMLLFFSCKLLSYSVCLQVIKIRIQVENIVCLQFGSSRSFHSLWIQTIHSHEAGHCVFWTQQHSNYIVSASISYREHKLGYALAVRYTFYGWNDYICLVQCKIWSYKKL